MATIDYKQKIKDYMNSSEVDTLYKSMLINLFPELKESEDERIRKKIIQLVNDAMATNAPYKKEMLAWLEKQGEQKPWSKEEEKIYQSIMDDTVQENQLDGKQTDWLRDIKHRYFSQSKQEWSEEDKEQLDRALYMMEQLDMTKSWDDVYNWLKSLKDRVLPQSKQEWSKEDESHIRYLIECLEYCKKGLALTMSTSTSQEYINWLKSIIPQSQWKPSKEQMQALSDAGNSFRPFEEGHKVLWSLYNDLIREKEKCQ